MPESTWELTPPDQWPDFKDIKRIGLDTETRDPNLLSMGPGFCRGESEVVGISLSDGTRKIYLPVAHEDGENHSADQARAYIQSVLANCPNASLVGTNIRYDIEGLEHFGIDLKGRDLIDISVVGSLIDEECPQGHSLEALGKRNCGYGKSEDSLREAAIAQNLDPKADLWRLDPKYVGEYAEDDAWLPLKVFEQQEKEIEAQDLGQIWNLERQITPILHEMKKQGVPVNVEEAERYNKEFKESEQQMLKDLEVDLGWKCDPGKKAHQIKIFQDLGLDIRYTEKGNPSINDDDFSLFRDKHKNIELVANYLKMRKMRKDFIVRDILQHNVNGRVHPGWRQLRSRGGENQGGTVSGRLSGANPNLMAIPSRDKFWGPVIRGLYLPEEGKSWFKFDYSQQEYRILVHFACLMAKLPAEIARKLGIRRGDFRSALEVAKMFHKNPNMDYHQVIADMVGIERTPAKSVNFGVVYGIGDSKLAAQLGVTEEHAQHLLSLIHGKFPFKKAMALFSQEQAELRGYVRTLLHRRRHFNFWESKTFGEHGIFSTKDEAEDVFGAHNVKRAGTRKALNSVIQGSGADTTKKAMVDLYNEGILMPIQVHDELDGPFDPRDVKTIRKVAEIMENAVEMLVPSKVDPDWGPNWGNVRAFNIP